METGKEERRKKEEGKKKTERKETGTRERKKDGDKGKIGILQYRKGNKRIRKKIRLKIMKKNQRKKIENRVKIEKENIGYSKKKLQKTKRLTEPQKAEKNNVKT